MSPEKRRRKKDPSPDGAGRKAPETGTAVPEEKEETAEEEAVVNAEDATAANAEDATAVSAEIVTTAETVTGETAERSRKMLQPDGTDPRRADSIRRIKDRKVSRIIGEITGRIVKAKEVHMEMTRLRKGERIDDLEVNGFRIIQNPSFFCFGMDAILLANFARTGRKDRVLDLGTGTGIIPLLLTAKEKASYTEGLELQEEVAEMAGRSVELNHAEDRCRIRQGDIRQIEEVYARGTFDAVTCNPPYIKETSGLHNDTAAYNLARHEIAVNWEDVVKAAAYVLRPGGRFFLVHKPFRLPELMQTLQAYRLEPKRMQLVQPHEDQEPNMVLLEAVQGGGPQLTILPTLVVYNRDGSYTERLLEMYGKP